jgi:hypothetical protein
MFVPGSGAAAWAAPSGVRIKLGIDLSIGAALALADRSFQVTGMFEPLRFLVDGWVR